MANNMLILNGAKKGIVYYCEKIGVKIPVNASNLGREFKNINLIFEESPSIEVKASLGDFSLCLKDRFANLLESSQTVSNNNFANLENVVSYSSRSKSGGSIYNKLMSGYKKGKVYSFNTAKEWITDGIGHRYEMRPLPKLSKSKIVQMVNELEIDGRRLTYKEKRILNKYIFNEEKMTPKEIEQAFPLFEKFANPLIEMHTKPQVDGILLSMVKNRMVNEGLTIAEIREQGLLSEDLIHRLMTENIMPEKYDILNNYRGEHGLPVFTNRQVQMMRKASGGSLIVHSRPDMLEYSRHPQQLSDVESAIKKNGFRGAQFKADSNVEYQFRGVITGKQAETQHCSYDALKGKFITSEAVAHAEELKRLSESQLNRYDMYMADWFNQWAREDLGLPSYRPKLPSDFNNVLSMEYIECLHNKVSAINKVAEQGFVPHFEGVA